MVRLLIYVCPPNKLVVGPNRPQHCPVVLCVGRNPHGAIHMSAPAKNLKDLQLSHKPATQHETPEQVEAAGTFKVILGLCVLPRGRIIKVFRKVCDPKLKKGSPVEVEVSTTMPVFYLFSGPDAQFLIFFPVKRGVCLRGAVHDYVLKLHAFLGRFLKTVGNLVCRPVLDAVLSLSSACFYTETKNLVGNFVFAGHVCSSLLYVKPDCV
eukprot:g49646.t1